MSSLLVMKFGGTSMGAAERIRGAAQICADVRANRPVVVVVSAMSKITDFLLDTLRAAETGRPVEVETNLKRLESRHVETCRALLNSTACPTAICEVGILVGEFQRIAHGMLMLGERPPRSVDEAIVTGERLSAMMMAAYLNCSGVRAQAVNAAELIVTDNEFGNAEPMLDETCEKGAKRLLPIIESGAIPIVTGFNGATVDGRPTTLGRGGSDFSASILASVLDAEELWIWSDVDGIMTADPPSGFGCGRMDEVTYKEAAELAYNGAKVLHPRTLAPLDRRRDSGLEKNSFNLSRSRDPDRDQDSRRCRLVPVRSRRWRMSLWYPWRASGGERHGNHGACVGCPGWSRLRSARLLEFQLSTEFCFLIRKETNSPRRSTASNPSSSWNSNIIICSRSR